MYTNYYQCMAAELIQELPQSTTSDLPFDSPKNGTSHDTEIPHVALGVEKRGPITKTRIR